MLEIAMLAINELNGSYKTLTKNNRTINLNFLQNPEGFRGFN